MNCISGVYYSLITYTFATNYLLIILYKYSYSFELMVRGSGHYVVVASFVMLTMIKGTVFAGRGDRRFLINTLIR